MKISEAIALLQKCDPDGELCVYNHEFSSADSAEVLLQDETRPTDYFFYDIGGWFPQKTRRVE